MANKFNYLFVLISRYIKFLFGLIFIFIIGGVYAFLQPEGIALNLIFLVIAIGWIIYITKTLWEAAEMKNSKREVVDEVDIEIKQPKKVK